MLLRLQTLTTLTLSPFISASPSASPPLSTTPFSSTFQQPPIPNLTTNVQSHFIQHKWDQNVSHITAGYWYNSVTHSKVRIDEAYDGTFGSSLFDYTNTSSDGQVSNKVWLVSGSAGAVPTCFDDYVSSPGFPLVTEGILKDANAVFGGWVADQWVGEVQTWNFMYGSAISVTAFLDQDGLLMGFDFWGAERRTKVVTRFFNIVVGEVADEVFEGFPCK